MKAVGVELIVGQRALGGLLQRVGIERHGFLPDRREVVIMVTTVLPNEAA